MTRPVDFQTPKPRLHETRKKALHPVLRGVSPHRDAPGFQDELNGLLRGKKGGGKEGGMCVPDVPIKGLRHGGHVPGLGKGPGQVGSAQGRAIGTGGGPNGVDGHGDPLVLELLDHPPHPLFSQADGPLFVTPNDLRVRIDEIPQKMQLPLVQGGADLQGRHDLDGTADPQAVQAPDPGRGVVVGQRDDVQVGRFAPGENFLRGHGSVGSGRMDVKVQAHRAAR
jgi:hypothetical protein